MSTIIPDDMTREEARAAGRATFTADNWPTVDAAADEFARLNGERLRQSFVSGWNQAAERS